MIRNLLPRIIFSLLLTVAIPFGSVAQSGLALTLINYTVQNDTGKVNLGYTITINAELTNTDSQDFSGQLDFGLRNNSGELTNVGTIFNKPTYSNQVPPIVISPGETVPAIFSIDIETPYFAPGPDVVVVWPISTKPVADSILIPLLVLSPNDVAMEEAGNFKCLVLSDRLILQDAGTELNVQQVRIYDLYGRLIAEPANYNTNQIMLNAIPKGIYLCEVTMKDNTRRVVKFIH
jgi:hypothetical protein